MTELAAWILFPLIALAICTGIGLLAERLARAELEPPLIPALGFAAAIVVLGPLFTTGLGGVSGAVLLALLASAGFVLGDVRRMRPSLGALTGAAAYALHIAPVALTGGATFLGYNLLNDTAIHLALIDWIGDHGSRYLQQSPSSYAAAIKTYVGNGYPLGSHELLAALKPFTGLDPAELYQPFLAFAAGISAAAIFALAGGGARRRRGGDPSVAAATERRADAGGRGPRERRNTRQTDWIAALTALAALASQLVFSFALQGSIKELAFIACLAVAAGVARHPALLALPAAAMFSIYGVASLAWIAPLAVLALVLLRPALRAAAAGVAVFLIAIAAYIPDAFDFYNHGHETLTSGEELGPLAGPLKFVQVAGVWLNGDYRFSPTHSWITYALAIGILGLAVAGIVGANRRRATSLLLFAGPALFATAITAPFSSPYIDAKLLAILSPAVIVAACSTIAAIRIRPLAIALAAALALALLVSDALAYRIALPAPVARLDELTTIDERFAGQGPILVNEFEEYVKHYMRRSHGSDPYESWTAARARLRNPKLPVDAHRYDLDQMKTSFVERWPLIVLRRSPVESRPPSNYDRVLRTDHYEVWQRKRPAPIAHIPLGKPPFDQTANIDCALVRKLASGGEVVAAIRPRPVVIPMPDVPLPAGWYRYGQDKRMLEIHKGGRLTIPARPLGPAQLWLRGRTTRDDRISGEPVPRSLQRISEWIRIDPSGLNYQVPFERPKRSLRPGDAQPDIVGPLVAVLDRQPRRVRASTACGMRADWIDILPIP
jgi:hypothetical protein